MQVSVSRGANPAAAIFLFAGAGKLVDVEDTSLDSAEIGVRFRPGGDAAGVLSWVRLCCSCWAARPAGLSLTACYVYVPETALFEHPFLAEWGR